MPQTQGRKRAAVSSLRVLDPAMESTIKPGKLAPRPKSLNGQVLWILDHGARTGEEAAGMSRVFRVWREMLEKEYQFKAIHRLVANNVATPFRHGREKFEEIARTGGVVINGGAVSGSTTSCAVHDAIQLEKRGVATVTMVHDDLTSAARAGAATLGIADLRVVLIAQEADRQDAPEGVVRKAAQALYPQVVQALIQA